MNPEEVKRCEVCHHAMTDTCPNCNPVYSKPENKPILITPVAITDTDLIKGRRWKKKLSPQETKTHSRG